MGIRGVLAVLAASALAGCAAPEPKAQLAEGDSGTLWFSLPSTIQRAGQFAFEVKNEPLRLSGALYFPEGRGPFPLVILAHGCGGVGNAESGWAPVLREWGYATFVLDSFQGRGLREVCSNSALLSGTQRVPDAYAALRMLATHPRVDAKRVALMGFSHGAILTLGASTAWARETFAPGGAPAFRAFFAFYPYCNATAPEYLRLSAPLRIHAAALDDWTPAAPCGKLAQAQRAAGQDAEFKLYPGAHHSFDNLGTPVRTAGHRTFAKCFFEAPAILGPYRATTPLNTCVTHGVTFGMHEPSIAEARRALRGELAALLK